MRAATFILLCLVCGGCSQRGIVLERPPSTAALAFTPPVVRDTPPVDLSRDGRDLSAYVGYDQGSVSYLYVRQDDRQGDGTWYSPTRFERRAISTTYARRVR